MEGKWFMIYIIILLTMPFLLAKDEESLVFEFARLHVQSQNHAAALTESFWSKASLFAPSVLQYETDAERFSHFMENLHAIPTHEAELTLDSMIDDACRLTELPNNPDAWVWCEIHHNLFERRNYLINLQQAFYNQIPRACTPPGWKPSDDAIPQQPLQANRSRLGPANPGVIPPFFLLPQ